MLGDEEGCVAINGLCTVRLILLTDHISTRRDLRNG